MWTPHVICPTGASARPSAAVAGDPPTRIRRSQTQRRTIIGATVSELIDAFAGDGHADLIPQLTFPFPVRVIARILGLAEADWPRFLQLSTQLIAVMRNWEGALAASRELRGYFGEIIADRRRNTRDDLVSQLISAEVDGRRLSDEEIYPFLLLLLPAGAETTYRSSSNLLFGLLSCPDQLEAVRADRSLVPQAIEEALRWETPLLTVARSATEEVELGGVRIPAGSFVAVSLGAANRDPGRYAEPDVFDIFRDRASHIAFGAGFPHTRVNHQTSNARRGVNRSQAHVDVMIGSDELEATGLGARGRHFAIDVTGGL